jgi:cytochrome c553
MLIVVFLASLGLFVIRANARAGSQTAPSPAPAAQTQATDNATCLGCHANPGQQVTLPSGEVLYVTIDPSVYEASVHGEKGYACVQCHTDIKGYPHEPITAETRRDYSLEKYRSASYHQEQFNGIRKALTRIAGKW